MSIEPLQNHVLSALPNPARRLLLSQLEWVALPAGTVLHEAGQALRYVYFPTTATVSLLALMRDGAATEVAVVGHEGMVGVSAIMGGGAPSDRAVVHTPGRGLRMPAEAIHEAAGTSPPVMQALLRYTQSLFTQMAQTSACSRHHALDQRLCRWLLAHATRSDGRELLTTHESIANRLGVRREGVTFALRKLQGAGLIRYARGRISILDKAGLQAKCCECHGVIQDAYDSLRAIAIEWEVPQQLRA